MYNSFRKVFFRRDSILMVTLVLLLSLFVTFLSIVMTVGNALNKTSLAKFWALIATSSIFVTTFIFIIDSFDLIDLEKPKIVSEVNANGADLSNGGLTPGQMLGNNGDQGGQIQQPSNGGPAVPTNGQTALPANTANQDTRVAKVVLLDLFTKRFTGDLIGLPAAQKDWLLQRNQFYPVNTEQRLAEVKAMATTAPGVEQVMRNLNNYRNGIIHGSGVVLDQTVDANAGIQEMQLNVLASDGGVYLLYYPALIQVKAGDWVQFYGTPVAGTSMRSDMFGTVNTVLVYASYITK